MRLYSFLIIALLLKLSAGWETDFDLAKQKAQQQHKYILLNFSGSDWCGPCIKLHDEIFDNTYFKNFADNNLVLINADFPRLKKNQLSKDQQKKNDKLADKYNSQGSFPYTILLDADGKTIMAWDGFPNKTAEQFTGQIKELIINARN
jgi:thioredoxin-related protein